MNVLLTGATGLLGGNVAEVAARRGHKVTAIGWRQSSAPTGTAAFHQVDLRDENLVTREVFDTFPDVIINTAAVSDNRICGEDPESAEQLNTRLPARLADLARHLGAKLIHVSTDMVFDGARGNFHPDDPVRPLSLYGRFKRAAEMEIMRRAPDYSIIIRTTLLTGNSPSGRRSVHEKLFDAWSRQETAALFNDELRQPCAASNLAEVLVELAERDDLLGLHHWAGSEVLSRHEIGRRILERFNLPPALIRETRLRDHAEFQDRPRNLSLDIGSLSGKLKTRPLDFEKQLDLLRVPPPFREWYNRL